MKSMRPKRTSMFDANEDREENCGTNAIVPVNAGTHNMKFNFTDLELTTTVDEPSSMSCSSRLPASPN